ncbi:unnamed protein product [Adineta ricciae]|uniref:NAD(P)(+)--arginine ADP-ribosyltransferase n=1 Tax=Adineta ricciae TaxID=249248 RepID=A0A815CYU9_ADIRI|nr:unnamed protein product [Adineta ricciae]CAF1406217.1 unnamed protein product [Adineta ricciae]
MNQIIEKIYYRTFNPLPILDDNDRNDNNSTSVTSTVSQDTPSQRRERFSVQANFTIAEISTSNSPELTLNFYEGPVFHTLYLIYKSWYDLTLPQIVEEAIKGILFEGWKQKEFLQAKKLADQLQSVKHLAENAKDVYDIPHGIGRTCIRLYTSSTFWYKSITSALWNPHTITEEQFKILGAFCYLLQTYMKNLSKKNIPTNTILTVYRGMNLTDIQVEQFKQKTSYFRFTSFTSTSVKREVADMFGNTLLVMDLNTMNIHGDELIDVGTFIGGDSQMPDEEEFLMWPLSTFQVTRYEFDIIEKKHVFYLKSSLPSRSTST